MKRDLDLIKTILLEVENSPSPTEWVEFDYSGRSEEEVSYHIKLLSQAGLIEADDIGSLGQFLWKAKSLTWQGHEFLDAARNDTVWNKVKSTVTKQGGSVPFSVLADLLKEQVRQ